MHVPEEDLVLHYYGELAPQDEGRVSVHIAECHNCHAAYRRLQQVLMAVDDRALGVPELPEGFERVVWARLEPSLERGRGGWLSRLLPSPSRLGWVTAAVVLVVSAFFAGRMSRQTPSTPGTTPTAVATTAANAAANQNQVRERILLIDLGEHLDRSQRVLVELVTAEGAAADFASERNRAEQLVWANRLYRETAAATWKSRRAHRIRRSESWTTSGGGSNRAACSSKCESCLRISWSGVEPQCGKRASVRRFNFIRAPNARGLRGGVLTGSPTRRSTARWGPIEEACS